MTRGPLVIERSDVARAWAAAFDEMTKPGAHEIVPLIVCVTGFENNVVSEDLGVRGLLEAALAAQGMQSVRTVASTIFPVSLWNPDLPADAMFGRYARLSKRLRKYRLNHNGIYFERMVDFHPKNSSTPINQLEYILATRASGNHRRSAYQISVLDPTHDHTDQPRRGFPCLQQVSISPIGSDELSITGFYATQTMFERAYGNYIGLCDLGRFFAHYWNLRLTRVTCVAAVAQLGIRITEARELAMNVQGAISITQEPAPLLSDE